MWSKIENLQKVLHDAKANCIKLEEKDQDQTKYQSWSLTLAI